MQIGDRRGPSDLNSPEALLRIPPLEGAIFPGLGPTPQIALGGFADVALEEGRSRPIIFYTIGEISLWGILGLEASPPSHCRDQ